MAIENGVRYNWQKGDIIRNKHTGHPYLVVHIYTAIGSMVVDMQDDTQLRPTFTIMMSDYGDYASDRDMETKTIQHDKIQWAYNPLLEI